MKAIIKKKINGKEAISIEQTFTDAPALHEFLRKNSVHILFKDAVDDLNRDSVTYNTSVETK